MPRRKGSGSGTGPSVKPAGSAGAAARTRKASKKVELNKTPLENDEPHQQQRRKPLKTPVTNMKAKLAGFPDRLNWKMTHYTTMPSTSTPKVDLTSRKVTDRDVDTAFGFDDTCNSDGGGEANYSTVISPIAHCSTRSETQTAVGVWKVNPLTQRNVEIEVLTPIADPVVKENHLERRSKRLRSQESQPQKSKSVKENEARVSRITTTSKPTSNEVSEAVTIKISPTIPKDKDTQEPVKASSNNSGSSETPQVDLPKNDTKAVVPKSKTRTTTTKKRLPKSTDQAARRSTRTRAKLNVQESEVSKPVAEVEERTKVATEIPLTAPSLSPAPSERNQVPTEQTLKPSSSNLKSKPRKLILKASSTKSNAKSSSTTAKRKKTTLLPEDVDDANGISPFSALLEKYTEEPATVELEGELHVDRKKIIRTYPSRKRVKMSEDRETEYDFVPSSNVEFQSEPEKSSRKVSSKKLTSKAKSKKKKDDDLDLDEETRRWLEEKNREFEDVLKAPLVIENSFSD